MTDALARLRALQAADLPVHGGRTLAYVYDSGLADVDRIGREAVAAYAGSNGLDPTAFPSLLRMENDLVGFALELLDAPGHRGRHRHLRRHRVGAARRAGRARRPPRRRAPADGAARHRARGVPQGRALLRRRGRCWCRSVPTSAPTSPRPRPPSTRPRAHRAGGGQRTVVRARRRRPGHRARRARRRARDPLPRRRLHRRLGAAVRRPARPRRAAVDVRGRRGHLDLGRPAQVRLRPQGHLAAAAPHAGAAPPAVLRLGGLAGLHDAELDDAVDEVGRTPGRRLGRGAVAGRHGLRAPLPRGLRGRRRDRGRASPTSPALALVVPPDSTLVALVTDDSCDAVHVCDEMADAGLVRPAADVVRRTARDHPPLGQRRDPRPRPGVPRRAARRRSRPRSTPARCASTPRCRVHRGARPGRAHRRRLRRPARRLRPGRRRPTATSPCPTGWPRSTRCSTWPRPAMREALLVAFLDRLQRPHRAVHLEA